ncbi:MAG: SPFH domain-containing protein, partial [Clostridia bacterium]|nr:SPFH domain-containing protein [Clostridia bacterium]
MGLIKAFSAAGSTALGDQWKEFFYCDSMTSDILVSKGKKRVSGRSSNRNGAENIISNGSGIAVNEGQCMMIVEQGKVVDLCAEAGQYTYDKSTEPSLFTGGLGKGILGLFQTIGRRFTYGGDTGKDQRVYYFNIKEILDNKFGTREPVPFRVVDNGIGLDLDIGIRCNGVYSYKIANPLLFYTNVCGNVSEDFTRGTLDNQLKAEFLTHLGPAFAKISAMGIRYSMLPGQN